VIDACTLREPLFAVVEHMAVGNLRDYMRRCRSSKVRSFCGLLSVWLC
jgi:hypothetical protein